MPKQITRKARRGGPLASPAADISLPNRVTAAHKQLAEAERLRLAGDLKAAQKICEKLIDIHPDYVAALHTLGLVHLAKHAYWPALSCFVRAAMLNPQDWTILTSLAQVYVGLDAIEQAAHTLNQTLAIKDDDAQIHFTLGKIYDRQREYELAAQAFQRAFSLDRSLAQAAVEYGSALVHCGDLQKAAEAFLAAHRADPKLIGPLAGLSQMPPALAGIDLRQALDKVAATSTADDEDHPIRVAFARANFLDRMDQHEAAWEALVKANAPLAARNRESLRRYAAQRASKLKAAEPFRSKGFRGKRNADGPVSLFILGVSRSGKTTLEHLLASLPGVKRGYENPIVERSARRTSQMSGLLTLDRVSSLPPELDGRFSEFYQDELAARAGDAKVFTNTLPGRISDIGRLAGSIPNLRFVFVKRNRNDTALRILMKHYKSGDNFYAYDLESAFAEIDWYHGMIDAWQVALPEICLCVTYEDMIADPTGQVARVAAHCGLATTLSDLPAIGDDRGCAEPYSALVER